MKLRTAYFCRDCEKEVKVERVIRECPHCGYNGGDFGRGIVYEWKVEVTPPFKEMVWDWGKEREAELDDEKKTFIPFKSISDIGIRYGDSCPIDFYMKLKEIKKKYGTDDEKTKTISKKRRRISDR